MMDEKWPDWLLPVRVCISADADCHAGAGHYVETADGRPFCYANLSPDHAAFIVRAVNSHDALRAAIHEIGMQAEGLLPDPIAKRILELAVAAYNDSKATGD